MVKCKEKSIFFDDGYIKINIECDFRMGHGGSHQEILKNKEILFTIRWKKQSKSKSKKTTAK